MLSEEVEYREGVQLPSEQVIHLYSQCKWSSAEKPEALLFALSNSETVISAWGKAEGRRQKLERYN